MAHRVVGVHYIAVVKQAVPMPRFHLALVERERPVKSGFQLLPGLCFRMWKPPIAKCTFFVVIRRVCHNDRRLLQSVGKLPELLFGGQAVRELHPAFAGHSDAVGTGA